MKSSSNRMIGRTKLERLFETGTLLHYFLEPVHNLDQGMQRKAKVIEKTQHTRSM